MSGLTKRFKIKLPSDYSEQTYASPYAIVRYAHQRRLKTAVDALTSRQPKRLLDYGAGDGQMIVEALSSGYEPESIVAYEPVEAYVQKLKAKLEEHGLTDRVDVTAQRSGLDELEFDCITCLEVLEHMPLNERESFYSLCEASLSVQGVAVVEVPVEVGPTLLVKNIGRTVLKGRDPEYSLGDLLKYSLGSKHYDPERFDPTNQATWIHDHKGFDYRFLREEAKHRFNIDEQTPSPVRWLPPTLGNQGMFFIFSRKAGTSVELS